MADPKTFHFDLDPTKRPPFAPLDEQWFPGIQDAAIAASASRIFDPIMGIRAVVIHATAGSSSAGAASVIFAGNASFHWLVPDENEPQHGQFVWATCHEARAAFHVRNSASHPAINGGANRVNHYSLGIEVVNAQTAADTYSDWQVEATARIVRYCWAKYPNLRHVVSHAKLDPSRRSDPGTNFPWSKFQSQVLAASASAPPELVTLAESMPVTTGGSCCMDV